MREMLSGKSDSKIWIMRRIASVSRINQVSNRTIGLTYFPLK